MPLGTEVGLSPGYFVFYMGTQLSPPQNEMEPPPQFSAHVHCGQTAVWIKMALGTEVGLDPGHIVRDGEPAPLPPKMGRSRPLPNFRPISIVAKQ